MLDLRDDPIARRATRLLAAAPGVALLRPSPHNLALVEGIEEDRADARWRPRAMPSRAGPRSGRALDIQSHRDLLLSVAVGHHLEDPPHDRRLVIANLPDNMRSPATLIEHGDISVAEDGTAGDVSALRLELERVASPLTGLRALQLCGEVRDRHDELVDRAFETDLVAPVLVLVDPDASEADLLQDVVRLELLAPQP